MTKKEKSEEKKGRRIGGAVQEREEGALSRLAHAEPTDL
jgi:hypothetical protein